MKSSDGLVHYPHELYLDLVFCGRNYGGRARRDAVVTCLWCAADDEAPF